GGGRGGGGKGGPRGRLANLDADHEQALARLFVRLPAASHGTLLKLAATLGSHGLQKHTAEIARALFTTIADEKQSDEPRLTAARQLAELRSDDPDVVDKLLDAVTP